MNKPLPEVTVTLNLKQVLSICTVFSMFSQVMQTLEMNVPKELKEDMADVLKKMMENLKEHVPQTKG